MNVYHNHCHQRIHSHRFKAGFTLLEIMVVLVLIGLTASYILPSLKSGNSQRSVQTAAKRFAALTRITHNKSLITGKNYGIKVTRNGYEFMLWQHGKWQSVEDDRLLKPVTLNSALDIRLEPGSSVWKAALELEAETSATKLTQNEESDQKKEPNIMIWSSGELTPATIALFAKNKRSNQYTITLKENGDIAVTDEPSEARL